MPYVTFLKTVGTPPRFNPALPDLDRLLDADFDLNADIPEIALPPAQYTRNITTYLADDHTSYLNLLSRYSQEDNRLTLRRLAETYAPLMQEDMSSHYDTFHIPKRTGGMRRIDAPHPELMNALRNIKDTFELRMRVLCHDAAHAYTPERSTITALKKHQENKSRWFLKIDLKDFFPSHNLDYILNTLKDIYPFSNLMKHDPTFWCIRDLIKLGLLNDKLPQGTPLSPYLTNLLMVPFDHKLTEKLKADPDHHYIYTRYADDLMISCTHKFNQQTVTRYIQEILREMNAPFTIKAEKTRFGSNAGRNWNLGIMLNKDNNLTIGHKQNQRFRAAVFNFLKDFEAGNPWSREDTQVLLGQISYYKAIEPDYVTAVIERYNTRQTCDFHEIARSILN